MGLHDLVDYKKFADTFCIDPSFKKSVKAKSNQGIYYRELGYILKTGAN